MPSKQVLNRQVQILENALMELRKVHNNIIREINEKTHCEECKKIKVEIAKKRRRKFDMYSAALLGIYTHTDYSDEPYNLFPKNLKEED